MIEKLDFQDVMEYDLPLTPPTSPCKFDIDIDLQDFETSLDEIPLPYKKHDSIVIKDCMWSPDEFSSSKIREHSYTRLYLGEPPSNRTIFETTDLSSKFLSSVDPAEVFPNVSCVDDRTRLRDLDSSDSGMINFLLFHFCISFVFVKYLAIVRVCEMISIAFLTSALAHFHSRMILEISRKIQSNLHFSIC